MAALRFLFANTYSINCIAWAEFVQLELYEVWYARNSNGEIGDGKVKQCRVCTDSYYDKGLSEVAPNQAVTIHCTEFAVRFPASLTSLNSCNYAILCACSEVSHDTDRL
jgi:hypothetical protein